MERDWLPLSLAEKLTWLADDAYTLKRTGEIAENLAKLGGELAAKQTFVDLTPLYDAQVSAI